MKYETVLKMRITISAVLAVLGMAALFAACSGWEVFADMKSWYLGSGAGMVGAGIAMAMKNARILRDKQKTEQSRIQEYDERNLYLRDKTMACTGYLMIGILYAGTLISGVFSPLVSKVLLMVLCGYLVLMCGIYLILRKVV